MGLQVISCDMEASRICGTMDAMNVPHARSPVTTFWEGEIVDNVHHSFFTHKWGASAETDMRHWSKFEAFLPIKACARAFPLLPPPSCRAMPRRPSRTPGAPYHRAVTLTHVDTCIHLM